MSRRRFENPAVMTILPIRLFSFQSVTGSSIEGTPAVFTFHSSYLSNSDQLGYGSETRDPANMPLFGQIRV
jgi:hypothetical protein